LTPKEINPFAIETGIVTMEDVETGEELELAIDAGLLTGYRKLFAARRPEIISASCSPVRYGPREFFHER
jgi:hypothetical protein